MCDEERARQLLVQILLLDEDNNSLHEQLASNDDRLDEFHKVTKGLQSQLDSAHDSLDSTQSDLRLKSREIETLKVLEDNLRSRLALETLVADCEQVELSSLHEVTMDSTKLLTEKLALARELSSLKPEMDHLRSQTKSYEAVIAEKLSLQRQLSGVQVELEMERRATQRAITKEGRSQVEEAKSAAQLESLQAELVKERKERLKIEREALKASADWEAKQATLETRMDTLKTELKTSKDQLKESESELQTARATSRAAASKSTANLALDNETRDPRKRNISRMDDDTVIGTPGDLRATKKVKRGSAMPGDKSTFSITPFLTRTTSVAPDSPVDECEVQAEREAEEITNPDPVAVKAPQGSSAGAKRAAGKPQGSNPQQSAETSDALRKAKPSKTIPKAIPVRKGNKGPSLEQVDEEDRSEDPAPAAQQLNSKPADTGNAGGLADNPENKKRKRKMLGGVLARTLFDDDDGESVKADKSGAKAFGTLGRAVLGGSKVKQRFDVGANASGFGGFSPLKKDRKGRD